MAELKVGIAEVTTVDEDHVTVKLYECITCAGFGYTEGMGEIHGRVCRLGQARGIASYHPAAALRAGPSVVDVMRADLRILKRLLETV